MERSDNWDELELYEINGVAHTLPQWCRIYGLCYATVYDRLKAGWPFARAIKTPTREPRRLTLEGETHTLKEWAQITGIFIGTLQRRLARGWSIDRVLTEPLHAGRPRKNEQKSRDTK